VYESIDVEVNELESENNFQVQDIFSVLYEEAGRSLDPSTQNSAILVDEWEGKLLPITSTLAVNSFPHGVRHLPERWERPLKYQIVEHAERNSLYKAASLGIATYDMVMVSPWAACTDCARAIIQCGVRKLITHKQAADLDPSSWRESIAMAFVMLKEADVEVEFYDGVIGGKPILHSGEVFHP
jgi:dCMP deaminase